VMACRTELFARLATATDATATTLALARAREARMPTAELNLFTAWSELITVGETQIALPADAIPLLEVTLEALLRVQDFEVFELLLGLLERTTLDKREQRQLLAEMYLRRGFLASAAEEWMAICQEQPDVRALLGLGQIAQAQGMSQEAIDFAAAALAHEPENPTAAHLLSAAQAIAA
jgi:tetratricopeptide (TPR) repeat protein